MIRVELECQVVSIPEEIRANIAHLKTGENLTAGELELPDGALLVTDANAPVATVRVKGEEVEEEEVVEGAETTDSAEPEMIAREKAEEEPKS